VDEELLNRCLVLTVNEDRAQTQAIHRQKQREAQTLEGLLRAARTAKIVAPASQRAAALEAGLWCQSLRAGS
jgi:hypothetical protein